MIVRLKSNDEIEQYRYIGKIARKIINQIIDEIKEGTTTFYLNEIAHQLCLDNNVKPVFLGYRGFPAVICASVNEVLVHGIPNNNTIIREGDVVSIDIGVSYEGFIGDVAESVVVGQHFANESLVNWCKSALKETIKLIKPKAKLKTIAENITALSNNYGIPKHYGGHGIERHNLHSFPFVANRPEEAEDIRLHEGMVLAIEPMFIAGDIKTQVAEDGWSVIVKGVSAHQEETILITDVGAEILTR